ncbi:hypothetical protein TRIP_C20978 [Candidatus Zixiibacteriota bacterium]|nr:hypothetical protein TRIP_C20978 [candidate division Zixibacteria bacterium]
MPTKFNKSTDSEHKEKLDSNLLSALWRTGIAIAGEKAEFEILTSFVGQGAEVKVTGKSEKGKKLGKVSGQMKNNKFIGSLDIPDELKRDDAVYFEVELSKNGIKDESNHIPVLPIKVSNMKWSAKEARRGDLLKLTADVKGCYDGTEVVITIYQFDRDNIHDKIVEIPAEISKEKLELLWEFQFYEDTGEIPTDDEMKNYGGKYSNPEYFFTIKIAGVEFGKKQESGLLTFKDSFETQLVDRDGQPIPDRDYELTLPDGTKQKGKTDKEGKIFLKDVPPGNITIEFPEPPENASQ